MRASTHPDWFAVYTKPRQEQIALANLEAQSFSCFLPMIEQPHRQGGARRKIRFEPLFPRYLFVHASPETQSMATVRSTRGAVGLIRAGHQLIRINPSVIADIRSRVDPDTGCIPVEPVCLRDGDNVRVFGGPLATLEGVFKEHRGQTRSLLLLEILGQETAVEIDRSLLQRVS